MVLLRVVFLSFQQSLGTFNNYPHFVTVKKNIEENFREIKDHLSVTEGNTEPKLSQRDKQWSV